MPWGVFYESITQNKKSAILGLPKWGYLLSSRVGIFPKNNKEIKMKFFIDTYTATIMFIVTEFFVIYMPVMHVNEKTSSFMFSELKKVEEGNYGY